MLARGTSADNRTTTWSVQAIEKYTSISRARAHDALHIDTTVLKADEVLETMLQIVHTKQSGTSTG